MTTAIPAIAVTIGGVPATSMPVVARGAHAPVSENLADNLNVMYLQATKGEERVQWLFLPPPIASLGVRHHLDTAGVYLTRHQSAPGNRSRWSVHHLTPTQGEAYHIAVVEEITLRVENGYTVMEPQVVKIRQDEYVAVWNSGDTPQACIRAVDKVLIRRGLTVK